MACRLLPTVLLCPLLASIPLAATADIALTGQAAMGLGLEQGKAQATTDLQLTLQAETVTDGGITFGAVIDVSPSRNRSFRKGPPRAVVYMSTGDSSGSGLD